MPCQCYHEECKPTAHRCSLTPSIKGAGQGPVGLGLVSERWLRPHICNNPSPRLWASGGQCVEQISLLKGEGSEIRGLPTHRLVPAYVL